jgi:hypothetical protein
MNGGGQGGQAGQQKDAQRGSHVHIV